jgi:hypothetical protein
MAFNIRSGRLDARYFFGAAGGGIAETQPRVGARNFPSVKSEKVPGFFVYPERKT